MSRRIVWCIGATDSGGGAGLHADLRSCEALGVHAAAAVTAVTAQSGRGVRSVRALGPETVSSQLATLSSELRADAIKIGMLATQATVETVERCLRERAGDCAVVLDPVLRAGADGAPLLPVDARAALLRLCAHARLLTPNLPEAEWLLGRPIHDARAVERAAQALLSTGAGSVLIKGGHAAWRAETRSDYWHDGRQGFWLRAKTVRDAHSHGSGCVLASAIAALLAQGQTLHDALVIARAFLHGGLRRGRPLGPGRGPVGPCRWPTALEDLPQATLSADERPAGFARVDARALTVYPITDRADHAERLMAAGARAVQLRVKSAAVAQLERAVRDARDAARRHGAALFVNDHWQLAAAQRATGAHLGQEDLAGLQAGATTALAEAGLALGVSTHGWWEVARAHALEPSYIAVGPVFETHSKEMSAAPQGIGGLQAWCEMLAPRYPVVAIGGLHAGNAALAFAAGAHGVAAIRAVADADGSVGQLPALLRIAGLPDPDTATPSYIMHGTPPRPASPP